PAPGPGGPYRGVSPACRPTGGRFRARWAGSPGLVAAGAQASGFGGRRARRASRSSSATLAASRLASSTARSTSARLTATCRGAAIPRRTVSLRTSTTVRTMSSPMTICSTTLRLSTSTQPTLPSGPSLGRALARGARLAGCGRVHPLGGLGGRDEVGDPRGPLPPARRSGLAPGRRGTRSPGHRRGRPGQLRDDDGHLVPLPAEEPLADALGPHDLPAELRRTGEERLQVRSVKQ